MTRIIDDQLGELRQRYNAAYTAYQSCVLALNESALLGEPPSKMLLGNEAKALRELTEARAKLLTRMVAPSGNRGPK
jgi:hypothetical protein